MVSPKPQKRFKTSHDNDESDTIQSFPQARVDDESSESSEGSDDDEHLLGPMDLPSAENIHTDLAEELNNLSIRVREDALHDIHGVAYAINETKELVDKSLKDFDQIIQLKKDKKSAQAYELAASISEEYVSSRKRRLMFLRAERFVCKKAANRYFNFFRNKLDLFGEAKLCKDITLDDLDEDDMDCLRAGHHQMVPIRDRSGRLVVSVTHANVKYKHPINLVSSTQTASTSKKPPTDQEQSTDCIPFLSSSYELSITFLWHALKTTKVRRKGMSV